MPFFVVAPVLAVVRLRRKNLLAEKSVATGLSEARYDITTHARHR
jgi:hypothetical protein